MPLINCEVSLALTWFEKCILTSKATRDGRGKPLVLAVNNPTNVKFKITDTNLHVPVVTLSPDNDNRLLEQLKKGLKRTIKWNKYRSEMANQTRNNNLNYLIDPTFINVNRLFVLSFKNDFDRNSFSNYYVPKVEVKDFNVLIDGKPFLEIPVKNKEEAHQEIVEMSKNNDYITGSLLNYEYFKYLYKLIAIDLSKQLELENPNLKQQINFIGRLEEGATMFFIIEKKEEIVFDFSKNSVIVVWLNGSDNESSKFATRKWYIINDQNNGQYGTGDENGTTIKCIYSCMHIF